MSTIGDRPGRLPGLGMFCCGMSVIVAATVLNVAHDRLSGNGLEALPPFLANMYDMSGKSRVTLALVTAGLSIILMGSALQRTRRTQRRTANSLAGQPYFSPSDEAEPGVSNSGAVVLRTWKYLTPQHSLSGTTGWPTGRTPPAGP